MDCSDHESWVKKKRVKIICGIGIKYYLCD